MTNKIFRAAAISAVAVLMAVGSAYSQKKITVRGEVVEVTSFVKDGLKPTSPSKKEMVIDNLKKGGMFGIVDRNNRLYLIIPGQQSDTNFVNTMAPYLGVKSFIKGTSYVRAGVRLLLMEDIGRSLK